MQREERRPYYNILDYVSRPNTEDLNVAQRVIDLCKKNGGGTVYFPPGTYVSGPIKLASNITLFLDSGVKLIFSNNFDDYSPVLTRWEGVDCYGYSPLIYGYELENVSIIGHGILDGQGEAWWNELNLRRQKGITSPQSKIDKKLAELNPGYKTAGSGGGGREMQFLRPPLIQLMHCRNVLLQGLTHQNSPFWNTHIVYCNNVVINNVTFKNPADAPNTDGLDIDSCVNVRVSDCHFDVGDDCLCLKSGSGEEARKVGRPTENVTITNCTMQRGHGAVVIGSETAGNIRNIVISNCIFSDTDRGIRLKSRRGRAGIVEDIQVNNIIMNGVLCPIVMNLFYKCGADPKEESLFSQTPQPISDVTPMIRNISISNIMIRGARAAAGFFHGLPERPIQGICLNNINIEMVLASDEIGGEPAMAYGMQKMSGKGIIAKYIKDVQFYNVRVVTSKGEGLNIENSEDIEINEFNMNKIQTPMIMMKDVKRVFIRGFNLCSEQKRLIQLYGRETEDVFLFNNSCSPIKPEKEN